MGSYSKQNVLQGKVGKHVKNRSINAVGVSGFTRIGSMSFCKAATTHKLNMPRDPWMFLSIRRSRWWWRTLSAEARWSSVRHRWSHSESSLSTKSNSFWPFYSSSSGFSLSCKCWIDWLGRFGYRERLDETSRTSDESSNVSTTLGLMSPVDSLGRFYKVFISNTKSD
jgi:hypothetical protein